MDENTPQTAPRPGRLPKFGLTTWIFIGLLAGILLGIACNRWLPEESALFQAGVNGVFFVLGRGFVRLMQMLVVPLVFASIVCGTAALGSGTMLGRIGGTAIVLYLFTTLLAVCLALLLGQAINPGVGLDLGAITQFEVKPAAAGRASFKENLGKLIRQALHDIIKPQNIFMSKISWESVSLGEHIRKRSVHVPFDIGYVCTVKQI